MIMMTVRVGLIVLLVNSFVVLVLLLVVVMG
jgi:hypothetical protein